jgi:hypothetical protein
MSEKKVKAAQLTNGRARAGAHVSGAILSRADAYKRALSLLPLAFDALESLIETGEPREQADAVRVLAQVIGHLAPTEEPKVETSTPEELEAKLVAAESSADVREFLVRRGWRPPVDGETH